MGFKDARAKAFENKAFQAMYGLSSIMNGELRFSVPKMPLVKTPIGGASASLLPGEDGPVLVVRLADGVVLEAPVKAGDEAKAEAFAGKVNVAGEWYATHVYGDGAPA